MKIIKIIEKAGRMIFCRISLINYSRSQKIFWEMYAEEIHEKWGRISNDYQVLSAIIDKYKPASILDVGCGSGRLFRLYQEKGISDVIGIDISEKALKLAKKDFPNVKTMKMRLEDMDFEHNRFDMAISNRTLQHIPRQNIDTVIKKICFCCKSVYINELTDSLNTIMRKFLRNLVSS